MRVAYDYQIFCQQAVGGISRYVTRLAAQLAPFHHVGIFAPLHQSHCLADLPPGVVRGRGLTRYPRRTSRAFFFLNRQLGAASMRRWRPDIVHETYYSDVCTGPGNVPKVLTVYDMISELFPESLPRRDDSSRLKRRAVARADHVICISRSTREDLLRLFDTRPEKVSYVHLGFERFAPQTGPSAAGAVPNRPFLLYVGARSGYKNFDAFLQSVAASPRLARDFSIVAFGGGSFTTAQQERIRSLGFGDGKVIHVAGDDALLGAMYEAARAFVYPSIYEGFGLPLLEAAAHDCPIACSNTSSMPEVIGDAAEFFDPRSAEGMTLAIERVVYSQARTGELLARGRERLAHFSWQKCARETASIYSTLL